jgi:parallel beta-helix repeat protein
MTFIRSLAVSGLIAAGASPANAFTVPDFQLLLSQLRANLGLASQPAPAPAPVVKAPAAPVVQPQPAPARTVPAPSASTTAPVRTQTVAPAPTRATARAPAVGSESYWDSLSEAVSAAGDTLVAIGRTATKSVSTLLSLDAVKTDLSRQVALSTGQEGSSVRTTDALVATAIATVAAPLPAIAADGGGAETGEFSAGSGGSGSGGSGGTGATYYVDFTAGNDANSGTSSASPWKRAPGDPLAIGAAAAAVLRGGDTVRFKGGTSYRGSIKLRFSGAPGNPITYSGLGFGTGNALIDGAERVTTAVTCPSQLACGGAPNWASLRLVTFTVPTTSYVKLYDAIGPLAEAIVPAMADPFFGDDIDSYAVVPRSAASALAAGRLTNATLAAAALGQPQARLSLWVKPNKVIERTIFSISGSTIYFDPTDVVPYTDRDGRAAIVGSVKGLTKPGGFTLLGPGVAVVYPRSGGGTRYFVGGGRSGIDLNGMANIAVSGFQFLRGTSAASSTREGIAITNIGAAPSNIVIENNIFGPLSMRSGYGAIHLNDARNLTIRGNRFNDLQWASGIRLGDGVVGATITGNRLSRGGRTGIYMQGANSVTVSSNIVSGYGGVHGNAMSAYLGNRNVAFTGNCVFASARPITFHGDSDSVEPNDLRISGNILVADADASAAIQSWGKQTRTVAITGNLLLGPKFGAILNADDIGVSVTRNRTSGVTVSGGAQPGDWVVAQNDESADYSSARAAATLSIDRCSATGPSGTITVSPL